MAVSSFATPSTSAPTVNKQVFTSSGSFIKPAGVKKITVTACGGGASYGSQTNYNIGPTGGFIEYEYDISSKADGASIPIVIGAGGTGVAGSGGTTIIDNKIFAPGAVVAEGYQPDAGVVLDSGDGYLKTIDTNDIYYAGAETNFHHAGYKFGFQKYVNTYDAFGSITTIKPDGTKYVFIPSTPANYNDIFYYCFNGETNYQKRPSISTNGNGTIVITSFFRSSVYGGEVRNAAIVTANHGQTWSLLDLSTLWSATGTNGNTPQIITYNNGKWIAYAYSTSSVETGTVMAVSNDLATWSKVGDGKFNAAAANNNGGVPYGGIRILSAFYDAANSFWYVARWSRSGYYQMRVYIERSSGPDLATATWTTQFYAQYDNGADSFEYIWYTSAGVPTLAKKANGQYVHAMNYTQGSSWYTWEFAWSSTSSTSADVNNNQMSSGMTTSSGGTVFACGFSAKLQQFLYFTSAASTSYNTSFFYNPYNGSWTDAGIFTTAGSNSYRYLYLSIGGSASIADSSHFISVSNAYAITQLQKAIVSYGSRSLPLGSAGYGGYGGMIKKIGYGNSTSTWLEPNSHPDKFAPAQYTDTSNVWFVYDETWPGAGGYYLSSPTGRWKTRNGNNGQVIIRWTA